jgi:hypothetical protein
MTDQPAATAAPIKERATDAAQTAKDAGTWRAPQGARQRTWSAGIDQIKGTASSVQGTGYGLGADRAVRSAVWVVRWARESSGQLKPFPRQRTASIPQPPVPLIRHLAARSRSGSRQGNPCATDLIALGHRMAGVSSSSQPTRRGTADKAKSAASDIKESLKP